MATDTPTYLPGPPDRLFDAYLFDLDGTVTLGDALLPTAGETIAHKCDGKAQCGSCHIFIQEGRKTLPRIQKLENEKLDALVGVSSKSRLACQTVMGEEPVTIELLSFV